jgi:hypothetical protein
VNTSGKGGQADGMLISNALSGNSFIHSFIHWCVQNVMIPYHSQVR